MKAHRIAIALALGWLVGSTPAKEPLSGEEVMRRVNQRELGADARLRMRLVLRDPRRGEHVREVDLRRRAFGESYRTLFRITSPPHLEDLSLLVAEDPAMEGMWMYFPASDHLVRVATRGLSALASDFSCEDLRVSFPLASYRFRNLGRASVSGQAALRIEMVPKNPRLGRELGYQRAVGWVLEDRWMIVRAEFFDERGALFKTFEAEAPELIDGVWTLVKSVMVNHRAEHESELVVLDAEYHQTLPEEEFVPENLTAGRGVASADR